MQNIAIELKELCALVKWEVMAVCVGDETVEVRPDGSVFYGHTDPQGVEHEIEVGQLTPDQYTAVMLPE